MFYFGLICFALALLAILAAIILTILRLIRKEHSLSSLVRGLSIGSFALHTLSVLGMLSLQILGDFQNAYVFSVINTPMPLILKITALWGGQAGSLFFWTWIVNLCLFIALISRRRLLDSWAFLIAALNVLFFGATTLFLSNPFNRIWELADGSFTEALFSPGVGAVLSKFAEGAGLNPLLRHPAMVIHPPALPGLWALPNPIRGGRLQTDPPGSE